MVTEALDDPVEAVASLDGSEDPPRSEPASAPTSPWYVWILGAAVALMWAPVFWRLAGATKDAVRVLGINDFPLHVDIAERFVLDPTQVEAPHLVFHAVSAAWSVVVGDRLAPVVTLCLATALTHLGVHRIARSELAGPPLTQRGSAVLATSYFFLETPVLVLLAAGLVVETTAYQAVHWWGNPTWLVGLPMTLLALPLLHAVVDGPEAGRSTTNRVRLCALVVLGSLAKPSFTIALVPALPLYLLLRRRPLRDHATALGWVVLPTVAVVATQTWFLGSGRSAAFHSSFAFTPLVEPAMGWERMGPLFWFPLGLVVAALVLTKGRFVRQPLVFLALLCAVVGVGLMLTVTETGGRALHGNMAVPAQMCIAVLVVLAIKALATECVSVVRRTGRSDPSFPPALVVTVCTALAVAFLAGGILSYLDAVGAIDVPTDWFIPPTRPPS